jgi:hypothetical protein
MSGAAVDERVSRDCRSHLARQLIQPRRGHSLGEVQTFATWLKCGRRGDPSFPLRHESPVEDHGDLIAARNLAH